MLMSLVEVHKYFVHLTAKKDIHIERKTINVDELNISAHF